MKLIDIVNNTYDPQEWADKGSELPKFELLSDVSYLPLLLFFYQEPLPDVPFLSADKRYSIEHDYDLVLPPDVFLWCFHQYSIPFHNTFVCPYFHSLTHSLTLYFFSPDTNNITFSPSICVFQKLEALHS